MCLIYLTRKPTNPELESKYYIKIGEKWEFTKKYNVVGIGISNEYYGIVLPEKSKLLVVEKTGKSRLIINLGDMCIITDNISIALNETESIRSADNLIEKL